MKRIGDELKVDFPIFKRTINGYPLVYLDNAATTQKPQQVIDAIVNFYTKHNANVFRGVYTLAEEATALYEASRQKIAAFIGADADELVFTSGTTEGINFIASAIKSQVQQGDEIMITNLEHHSNILPWQRVAAERGARLVAVPLAEDGSLAMDQFAALLSKKTKIIAVSQIGNVLGTRQDIRAIVAAAHAVGALVMVDAAQSVPHQKTDVRELGCDFMAFSGHKMLGPTGIGGLYIRKGLAGSLSPYKVGGGMVTEMSLLEPLWQKAPYKFEAGTPPIAEAIGLGAAVDYINQNIDFDDLQRHEAILKEQLVNGLSEIKNVKILGSNTQLKLFGFQVSFIVDGVHPHDVAAFCDTYGICVRAGFHCARPLAQSLGVGASVRASFYAYNTPQDVDSLLAAIVQLAGR